MEIQVQPRKTVYNFCGCWCCPWCNLRVNMIVVSIITIITASVSGIYYIFMLPSKPSSCTSENCYIHFLNPLLACIFGARICELIAGICLLRACSSKRSVECAMGGGALYILEALILLIVTTIYVALPAKIFYGYSDPNQKVMDDLSVRYRVTAVFVAIGLTIWCIYMSICCFQLRKQINSGIDLASHKPFSCKEQVPIKAKFEIQPPALHVHIPQPKDQFFIPTLDKENQTSPSV